MGLLRRERRRFELKKTFPSLLPLPLALSLSVYLAACVVCVVCVYSCCDKHKSRFTKVCQVYLRPRAVKGCRKQERTDDRGYCRYLILGKALQYS